MNYTSQNNSTSFFSENRKGLVILFVLFLLSSVGMFGQNKTSVVSEPIAPVAITTISTGVAYDSDVDFVNWFMGSKQTQNIQEAETSTNTSLVSKKKQIISSGITPNKVLYRTFVKKVISQESAIA